MLTVNTSGILNTDVNMFIYIKSQNIQPVDAFNSNMSMMI